MLKSGLIEETTYAKYKSEANLILRFIEDVLVHKVTAAIVRPFVAATERYSEHYRAIRGHALVPDTPNPARYRRSFRSHLRKYGKHRRCLFHALGDVMGFQKQGRDEP